MRLRYYAVEAPVYVPTWLDRFCRVAGIAGRVVFYAVLSVVAVACLASFAIEML